MNANKALYRDDKRGRIAGVCAGVADYFGVETWLVRIITVTAFLLTTGSFVFVGYIILWAILDKKPRGLAKAENSSKPNVFEQAASQGAALYKGYVNKASEPKVSVKDRVWKAGQAPKEAFKQVQQNFNRTENRLRKVESYVTSNEFQLNRELNNL